MEVKQSGDVSGSTHFPFCYEKKERYSEDMEICFQLLLFRCNKPAFSGVKYNNGEAITIEESKVLALSSPSASPDATAKAGTLAVEPSQESLYIWIGDGLGIFENLSCSFPLYFGKEVSNTLLFGDINTMGQELSNKLAQKFKIPIFVSFNVELSEPRLYQFIQVKLLDLIKGRNSWNTEQKVIRC